jgi:hypothetical protein
MQICHFVISFENFPFTTLLFSGCGWKTIWLQPPILVYYRRLQMLSNVSNVIDGVSLAPPLLE